MSKIRSKVLVRDFTASAEAVWAHLADTARFNEASGLPRHSIEEVELEDGSMAFIGRARVGPFDLIWEDIPVNWVSRQWFEHARRFRRGPLAYLCATLRLEETPGGCRAEYRVDVSARNLVGEAILRTGFFRSFGENFDRQTRHLAQFLNGAEAQPFDYRAPAVTAERRARADAVLDRLEASEAGQALGARLVEHVLSAQEIDLLPLRPLRLARLWQVPERMAVELCLEATRAGLLELRWDLLCPRCRVAKLATSSLDRLPDGAHCGTCNIDYGRDFSRNVELSFQPTASIRPLNTGEFCLLGPMTTPHIRAHVTLEPGESRRLPAKLDHGAYRLRTLEPGPETDFDWQEGGFPEMLVSAQGIEAGPPAVPDELRLVNQAARRRTLVIESREWVRDALTADRATSLQAFRDLFSDQVLRPGDEVAVRRVALMFTDIRGSTALYRAIGDAAAYGLVREHFALLTDQVRSKNGAVVKTIGDAVMAAFREPADALRAALAIQSEIGAFNDQRPDSPVLVKLGLHEGPCIAVNLNDRLDYFGSTVNLAARLQGESLGGDIVLSQAMAGDPGVEDLLASLDPQRESAALKGFDAPVAFFRIRL